MKKILTLFALISSLVVQADYLFWTVAVEDFTSAGLQKNDVKAMRVGYVTDNKGGIEPYWAQHHLTALDYKGESMGRPEVAWDESVGEDGYVVKLNLSDIEKANYGFYIELLNSSGDIIGRTGNNTTHEYATYDSLKSCITTGDIGTIESVSVWHGSFEAVPEPSSMALLALGAGLVGLRRRLRKNKRGKRA